MTPFYTFGPRKEAEVSLALAHTYRGHARRETVRRAVFPKVAQRSLGLSLRVSWSEVPQDDLGIRLGARLGWG